MCIRDSGCGIPGEKLCGLFTGYLEKEDVPADGKKRSMGIGLSVCAAIIRAHGGEIRAENRKPEGAVFRFWLEMEGKEHEQQ